MKKSLKYLIAIFLVLVIGLLFFKYKFEVWVNEYYIPFHFVNGNLTSDLENDWVSVHAVSTYSIDGKVCGDYGYNCVDVVKNYGLNKCILVGDLKESHDVFVGRHVFEGKVEYGQNRVACVPVGQYWWNGLKTKITGTYRFSTWYGWFEVNCDAGTFTASDGRSGTFDCNTQLEFRSVWNFQAIFYKEEITTTTTMAIPVTTTTIISVSLPPTPPRPLWETIISAILDWLRAIFSWFKFEIYGEQYPTVGSAQTYTINITTAFPDSDYSDGTYQVQYGGWVLMDKNGNAIQKGDWEQINGSYCKQITLTIPSSPGDYVIVGLIYQYDMKFNPTTLKWEIVSEGVVAKEAMNLNAKVIAPQTPKPPDILQVLRNFWCWFIGLFGFRC
jgi:hypothetical protein